MEKIIELTYKLKEELDSLPLFQEYKRVKQIVDNDEELKSLKTEIAKSVKDKQKHQELLDRYNSNPLVINYEALKKEIADYLKEVCDIINENN